MKNPIEYYDKPRKQNNRDKFYFGLRKIHIYVEDSGKKFGYKLLFKKIGMEDFECFDISDGKKGVINHYFKNENEIKSNSEVRYIFLLDKDFDNKCIHHNNKRLEGHSFEELKKHKNFVIWKKYCIENYLSALDLVIKTVEILCRKEIDKKEYEKKYLELYLQVLNLTKFYYFSSYFDLNLEYNINRYFNKEDLILKEEEKNKIEEKLFNGFLSKKDTYEEYKNKNYDEVFKKLSKVLDAKYDIHGKEFLKGIIMLNKKFLKKDWQESYSLNMFTTQLINNIDQCKEICEEIRNELKVM